MKDPFPFSILTLRNLRCEIELIMNEIIINNGKRSEFL